MKRSILLAATAIALLGLLVTARSFVSVVDQSAPVTVTPPSH
ncbi:hypothetical protein [Mesorhizobium sp. Cs1299R1N3]